MRSSSAQQCRAAAVGSAAVGPRVCCIYEGRVCACFSGNCVCLFQRASAGAMGCWSSRLQHVCGVFTREVKHACAREWPRGSSGMGACGCCRCVMRVLQLVPCVRRCCANTPGPCCEQCCLSHFTHLYHTYRCIRMHTAGVLLPSANSVSMTWALSPVCVGSFQVGPLSCRCCVLLALLRPEKHANLGLWLGEFGQAAVHQGWWRCCTSLGLGCVGRGGSQLCVRALH